MAEPTIGLTVTLPHLLVTHLDVCDGAQLLRWDFFDVRTDTELGIGAQRLLLNFVRLIDTYDEEVGEALVGIENLFACLSRQGSAVLYVRKSES